MVFALIDYINYKRKRNQYSIGAIRKQGGLELNDENYAKIFPLRPGFILIHHTHSFVSWLIMYFTTGVWSHTMNPVGPFNVLDVTLSGTLVHPFKDYFNKGIYAMIVYFNIPEDKVDFGIAQELAQESIGIKYGYHKAFRIFLYIIFGLKHSYRLKFSIDIFVTLLLFYALFSALSLSSNIFLYLSLFYIVFTIIGNTFRYLGIGKYGPTVKESRKFRKDALSGYKDRSK